MYVGMSSVSYRAIVKEVNVFKNTEQLKFGVCNFLGRTQIRSKSLNVSHECYKHPVGAL